LVIESFSIWKPERELVVALNKKLFVIALLIGLLAGCREDEKISAYRELRKLPCAEIERRVTALSPQEQVDMYVMAVSYFRPPDIDLAPILAKQGTRILPTLVAQLEKSDPNVSPQELVLILYMMVKAYHVKEAKELAPRVDGWCSRFYNSETYCHKMGREMRDPSDP
jgi:hypothetical protein